MKVIFIFLKIFALKYAISTLEIDICSFIFRTEMLCEWIWIYFALVMLQSLDHCIYIYYKYIPMHIFIVRNLIKHDWQTHTHTYAIHVHIHSHTIYMYKYMRAFFFLFFFIHSFHLFYSILVIFFLILQKFTYMWSINNMNTKWKTMWWTQPHTYICFIYIFSYLPIQFGCSHIKRVFIFACWSFRSWASRARTHASSKCLCLYSLIFFMC